MYCVMNIQKRKKTDIGSIQKEATRTADKYNNKVKPGWTVMNVELIHSENWMQDIQAEIDRAGAKARANSVVALDTIYTASPDFFNDKTNKEMNQYFEDCLQFHQQKYGHTISAVIHYDETTPHMHVLSVPLTRDGRLSARDVVGNKVQMSRAQTEFFEEVGRDHGLERGVHRDGAEKRVHITAQEHRLRETEQRLQEQQQKLQEQQQQIQHETQRLERLQSRANDEYKRLKRTVEQIYQSNRDLKTLQRYVGRAEQERADDIYRQYRYNDELER